MRPATRIGPDHPDIDEALDAMGLTEAERLGVEIVAALKADLYGRDDLDAHRRCEVLWCLLRHNPEVEADVASGVVTRERADRYLDAERKRLLAQAGYVGAAALAFVRRRHPG